MVTLRPQGCDALVLFQTGRDISGQPNQKSHFTRLSQSGLVSHDVDFAELPVEYILLRLIHTFLPWPVPSSRKEIQKLLALEIMETVFIWRYPCPWLVVPAQVQSLALITPVLSGWAVGARHFDQPGFEGGRRHVAIR